MKEPTPDQMERLPKWAQEYIADLQRRLEDSQRAAAQLRQDEPTQIYWYDGSREEKKYIPNDTRIRIALQGRKRAIVIHWNVEREALNVASEIGGLIVSPWSSNWIHVQSE